jgi:hypothetical protein
MTLITAHERRTNIRRSGATVKFAAVTLRDHRGGFTVW